MKTTPLLSSALVVLLLVGCTATRKDTTARGLPSGTAASKPVPSVTPTPDAVAPTPAAAVSEQLGSMQFVGAQIPQILAIYAELTGSHIEAAPDTRRARPLVSVVHPGPLPKTEAVRLIESALRDQAGVLLTRHDNNRVTVTYDDSLRKVIGAP